MTDDLPEKLRRMSRFLDMLDCESVLQAAEHIEELQKKLKVLEKIKVFIRTSQPEKSGYYFICGEGGSKDDNGLPERIHVCPAYGVDWMQIYERTNTNFGPEW